VNSSAAGALAVADGHLSVLTERTPTAALRGLRTASPLPASQQAEAELLSHARAAQQPHSRSRLMPCCSYEEEEDGSIRE
jgi:hypothetical protein